MVCFRALLLAGLAVLGALPGRCAQHGTRIGPVRAAGLTVETGDMLSVNFFTLPDSPQVFGTQGVGMIDLGKVSYASGSDERGVKVQRASRGFYVETTVGLRIGNLVSLSGETVSMKAWLQAPATPYQIYLDGVELTAQPKMVDGSILTGVVSRHELRIHVPPDTTENESSLQTQIAVQVVRN